MPEVQDFLKRSETKAFDSEHKQKLVFNINKYHDTVEQVGKQQYADLERAKRYTKNKRHQAIENLDAYLLEFEQKFTSQGGKVLWARDADEAIAHFKLITEQHNVRRVVKSKSMVTEEIQLNTHLEKFGVEVHETDLGEFIVQLANEAPYHIVTPAMHKSKEDVAELFHRKLGTPLKITAEELTLTARVKLREKYTSSTMGVTGGNFILPDIGAVAITENEGNARLTTSFPNVHVAVIGIEKVLPSYKDLATVWPLLATHGTGQNVTVYNTLLTGPKRSNEKDGPEHMYVILIDNGRTNILKKKKIRESLYCIRCGACLNVCPVYKQIGGHAYNTPYTGPIGSVITPHMRGMKEFKHLSSASTVCGNCTEACPVKIDLHGLLLENRTEAVDKGLAEKNENLSWYLWEKGMLNRKLINAGTGNVKGWLFNMIFRSSWNKRKVALEFPKKSFNELYKEKKKNGEIL